MSDISLSRRSFLSKLALLTAGGAVNLPPLPTTKHLLYSRKIQQGPSPLRTKAAGRGLLYGAAAGLDQLAKDKDFTRHFCQECAILVPETELKWKILRPSPDKFNFAPADWMLHFAKSKSMLFRGHTLVWHAALPAWFAGTVNANNAKQFMLEHITTVVKHYARKIHSWDVVNEPIFPPDAQPDGVRNSPWYKFLGPGYIEMAFRAASAADPDAVLVLNQNYLEYDSDGAERCRFDTLALLTKLKKSGTPVHALGTQAHLVGGNSTFNADKYNEFLNNVASLGLKIFITELDVDDHALPYDTGARDRIVAATYHNYLTHVLGNPSITTVLTWGLSDKYTWLDAADPRSDGAPERPLPLDSKFCRKPAWHAISNSFNNAPTRG